MRIAIIGCGTAGPVAALVCAKDGHEVTVFEKVPDPQPVGAGILLQPTGLAVLDYLGLREKVVDHAAVVNRLSGVTVGKRIVMDFAYHNLKQGLCGFGVHRGLLYSALFHALEANKIPICFGTTIKRWSRSRNLLRLHDDQGNQHGPFDLVVIANGARSELRNQLGVKQQVSRYPWAALWTVVKDSENAFGGALRQTYSGTRKMVGTLPTGRVLVDNVTASTVSLFWSLRADHYPVWQDAGLNSWKSTVRNMNPGLEPLLDQINDHHQLTFAEYYNVNLKKYHQDGVVAIGDAAHAMSPQLGQGANLGLVDGWEFAAALRSAQKQVNQETPAIIRYALQLYTEKRRNQLRFYRHASRALTPLFQGDQNWVAWPRDRMFHHISRLPFVHQQSLLSLAGVKDGLFTAFSLDPKQMLSPPP